MLILYKHTHTHTQTYIHIQTYVHTQTYIHTNTHIHTHTKHTYTHKTYIHTQRGAHKVHPYPRGATSPCRQRHTNEGSGTSVGGGWALFAR